MSTAIEFHTSRDVAVQTAVLSLDELSHFNRHWIEAHGAREYPKAEFLARDVLMARLRARGLRCTPEYLMPSGRADIAVWTPVDHLWDVTGLIEVKVASPLDGIGQLLSYRHGTHWERQPALVLAAPYSLVTRRVLAVAQNSDIATYELGMDVVALAGRFAIDRLEVPA